MHWLTVGIHHHFHGPRVDYVGIGTAALVSWVGVPGAGEAALITAGVLAAHHKLDIAEVIAVAWAGATVGGVAGWLVGWTGGRAIVTRGRAFRKTRVRALARGERFYSRYGAIAILFTPSWMAGINRMRSALYLPANAASALVWALGIGMGAYLVGPSVADLLGDLGRVGALLLAAAALVALVIEVRRRRRR